jgi:hypothetical protein
VTGGTITSHFTAVEQPKLVAWRGRLTPLGVEAIDVFHLEPRAGGSLVREEESGMDALRIRRPRSRCCSAAEPGLRARRRSASGEWPRLTGVERGPIED